MDQQVNQQRKNETNQAQKMIKLLENEYFKELILEGFITNGCIEQTLHMSLDNSKTLDELKARQILHGYIFGIIQTGEKAGI